MTGRRLAASLWLAVLAGGLCAPAGAAECPDWIARTVSVEGRVETRRAGQPPWTPVRPDQLHCPGDAVRVGPMSRAAVLLRSGAILRLDQNTTITFTPPAERPGTWVDLLIGVVHFFSRVPRGLGVTTPFVNGVVEGTEFLVEVRTDRAQIAVVEGQVVASNPDGRVLLASGQSAVARAGQGPVLQPIVVRPADAVQWAIHYPPVLDYRPADFPDRPGEAWPAEVRRSLEAAAAGDLEGAFAALAGLPPTVADPRVFAHRAGLLLSVGRVDQAAPEIERALALDPAFAPAGALRAVIAVAQNRPAEALGEAERAVRLDPSAATAHLALSYARQAAADLGGARASAAEAVRRRPDSALARARLAELWLAAGDVDRALDAARAAVRLEPGVARAQTVLGFVHLARLEIGDAVAALERASALDPGAPLPRLGLGLARIRRGELASGREALELAVSLDPASALARSYLGKAYYEERRGPLDADQFELAKALDPRDPTPYFYDAIRKQSVNRPVDALLDFERSIALNDERAVHRSRLFLDEDLAVRGASLGRLFDDLGFPQLALSEAWRSLRTDPAESAAHRLLADAYRALPRHDAARVSEWLQAQLLQPQNVAPVQPELGEGGLLILEGAGPSEPSLTEFHPLFLRDRLSLQLSGIAGSNATLGDEVVLSGLWGPLSVSVGQLHYETDGFRTNHDLEQDVYVAFGQVRLGPRSSVQAELRATSTERGDRAVRFLPDDFLPNERHERETWSARLGVLHRLHPGSELVVSLLYADTEERLRDVNPVLTIDERTDEAGVLGEAQHLFRAGPVRLVSGVGHLAGSRDETSAVEFVGVPAPPALTAEESDIRHTSAYVYGHLQYPGPVTWTLGVSADFLEEAAVERSHVNPKLGVAWDVRPGTTLRAAAFRALARPRIVDRTIEPTQVAGFNQFFGTRFGELDFPGTSAWRYGLGVDQRFAPTLYGGAEVSLRELDVPGRLTTPEGTTAVEEAWDEYLGRAYVYWMPHAWVAATVEYQFERFDRDALLGAGTGILEADTHRVGLGVTVFHPSGLSAGVKATYIDQDGRFVPRVFEPGTSVRGADRFWVADVTLRYRLPRRRGFVTVGARNVLDERFRFQDTDPANPQVEPERVVFVRVTLVF